MLPNSVRSMRRAYLDWIEEQLEEFKDSIPRSDLLRIADDVVAELSVNGGGQYQLTELLLCDAVDRRLVQMLKLPGYRSWCAAQHRAAAAAAALAAEQAASLAESAARVEETHAVAPFGHTPAMARPVAIPANTRLVTV